LNITRISAAHRPDAMSVSDSVVHLSGSVGPLRLASAA
jgi:hypothetical protein